MEHYSKTISVNNTPQKSYEAICLHMSDWWAPMTGTFVNEGDEAGVVFDGEHVTWHFRAIKLLPEQSVTLKCYKADHVHEGLPEEIRHEWQDTELVFEIKPFGNKTEITLTHIGLHPKLKCYDVCEAGWDHFFAKGLKTYLSS